MLKTRPGCASSSNPVSLTLACFRTFSPGVRSRSFGRNSSGSSSPTLHDFRPPGDSRKQTPSEIKSAKAQAGIRKIMLPDSFCLALAAKCRKSANGVRWDFPTENGDPCAAATLHTANGTRFSRSWNCSSGLSPHVPHSCHNAVELRSGPDRSGLENAGACQPEHHAGNPRPCDDG